MKIIIENTSKTVTLNGVPARIWEGRTESGIPIICYITRIAVPDSEDIDHSEFKREGSEERPPSVEAEAIPLHLIL